MLDPFWLPLLLKMLGTAVVVVVASLVAERSGPFLGAMIATLPVSAGPAYLFLAVEHGPEFIAAAGIKSLATTAALAVFVMVYAPLAQTRGALVCLAVAMTFWTALAVFFATTELPLALVVPINATAYAAAIRWTRAYRDARFPARPNGGWYALALRALMVMGLTAAVLVSGRALGPKVAGVIAIMPMVFLSLIILLHGRSGGPATAAVLSNALTGLIGFSIALCTVHIAAVPLGSAMALSLALAICIGWNLGLVLLRRLRR